MSPRVANMTAFRGAADCELLELAAKAAGYDVRWHEVWGCFVHTRSFNMPNPSGVAGMRLVWIPFDDDGDALRLVVSLNLDILQDPVSSRINTVKVLSNEKIGDYMPCAMETRAPDPYSAMRRAIVCASADIGRYRQEKDQMSPRYENMVAFKGGRIGSATVPRQRIELTADSVMIQRALLSKTRPYDRNDVIVMVGGCAVAALVMAMAWAGWLP